MFFYLSSDILIITTKNNKGNHSRFNILRNFNIMKVINKTIIIFNDFIEIHLPPFRRDGRLYT